MSFIDQMMSEGFGVESIGRVLREQCVQIAARTHRVWRQGRVSTRTVTDAVVEEVVRGSVDRWRERLGRSAARSVRERPHELAGGRRSRKLCEGTAPRFRMDAPRMPPSTAPIWRG